MPEITSISAIPRQSLDVPRDGGRKWLRSEGRARPQGRVAPRATCRRSRFRYRAKLVFRVSTTTPFSILQSNGTTPIALVKNQGITDGLLIWNMEERGNSYYGHAKGGAYRGSIERVYGLP